jgi:hypothetical protein
MKKGKRKAYAVINPNGYICVNLVRASVDECIEAHEEMFPDYPWSHYKEQGFRIKKIRLSLIKSYLY